MCTRYTLVTDLKELKQYGAIKIHGKYKKHTIIAPTQVAPIVKGDRLLDLAQWGLIPSWAKDERMAANLVNARSETLTEKPSFRTLLSRNRCLIPATGFIEWETAGKNKYPFHFQHADLELLFMAGLFDEWISPNGEVLTTYTIITTCANTLLSRIHDRMPVILENAAQSAWLDGSYSFDAVKELLVPFSSEAMKATAVSPLLNKAGSNREDLLLPWQNLKLF